MEWREQSTISCDVAFAEARRWVEEVTGKRFGSSNFRSALENGVLLCDLINKLKPGIIRRVNRLSTPIAGLDNVNVFLRACGKLGLNHSQLFHPGDLQDISNRVTVRREETSRRLKNVLITIYWLGRKAQSDSAYNGPQLNFKAFEGLLGVALSKVLEESWCSKAGVRDSGYSEAWDEYSVESLDTLSLASDYTHLVASEGFGSDAEAEHCFRMSEGSRSEAGSAATTSQRRKRAERYKASSRDPAGPLPSSVPEGPASCRVIGRAGWEEAYLEEEAVLLRSLSEESGDSDDAHAPADPVQDDLYARRVMAAASHTSGTADPDKFLPKCWTPEEGPHLHRIRQGSQRRPWYRTLQGFRTSVRRSRVCGSKSMSDIVTEPVQPEPDRRTTRDPSGSQKGRRNNAEAVLSEPSTLEQVEWWQEQPAHPRTKDGEAGWQDDLDRWKSRRRSVASDLHRKKEAREQLLSARGGADCRTVPHSGIQEESEREGALVFATRQQPQDLPRGPSTAQGPSRRPVPPSQPLATGAAPHPGSLASDEAVTPSVAAPLASGCSLPRVAGSGLSGTTPTSTNPASTLASRSRTNDTTEGRPTDALLTNQTRGPAAVFSPPETTEPVKTSPTDWPCSGPLPRAKSLEDTLSGGAYMSATLPRGFRRSEGASRLSMGVTPKPFRAKPPKVVSLPRFYSVDESRNFLSRSPRERPRLPVSFTSQGQDIPPTSEGSSPPAVSRGDQGRRKREEEEEEGEVRKCGPTIHSFMTASVKATAPESSTSLRSAAQSGRTEVAYSDMRVSLTQKPNRDFGFQVDWDSTTAHISSVQPGSPAQLCHLQVGDEIVCVGGRRVAEMSYEQWKACMDAALREGKLLMDVRRHGQNGWHNDSSALPFKSHKTIDLTSMDPALVSSPELSGSNAGGPSQPAEKAGDAQINGHTANGLPEKAKTGSGNNAPVPARNKGGSESAISDLQVPSISTSAARWSWDAEEERRRQEKWQMEQERLLQEKYKRDQAWLEEEWRRAQEAATVPEGGGSDTQTQAALLSNGNTTPYIPPAVLCQSASSTFVASSEHSAEVEPAQSRPVAKQQAAPGRQSMEECDSSTKSSQWAWESCGFAKLTTLDRKKSKSTPSLDSRHKQDPRGPGKKGRVSQVEQERQQILDEMRKKTPLHTDSSWIRQHSVGGVHKEPIAMAPVMRHDSLEDLYPSNTTTTATGGGGGGSSCSLPRSFSTRCSLGSAVPYRGYASRCSLGPGAAIFSSSMKQRSASVGPTRPGVEEARSGLQQRSRLVSGNRACSRCSRPLAKGAAMVIESLDLCFHVGCFKCVGCKIDLCRESEAGAQVRVRRGELSCDSCYSRVRGFPSELNAGDGVAVSGETAPDTPAGNTT